MKKHIYILKELGYHKPWEGTPVDMRKYSGVRITAEAIEIDNLTHQPRIIVQSVPLDTVFIDGVEQPSQEIIIGRVKEALDKGYPESVVRLPVNYFWEPEIVYVEEE